MNCYFYGEKLLELFLSPDDTVNLSQICLHDKIHFRVLAALLGNDSVSEDIWKLFVFQMRDFFERGPAGVGPVLWTSVLYAQCTSVKISQSDHLPNQLCKKCFLGIRFCCQFKEKSIKSKISLNEMLCKENELNKRTVNVVNSKPTDRLVKFIHLKPLPKSYFKAKRNLTLHRSTTVVAIKPTDNARTKEGKNAIDVQCELCGKVLEGSKSLQYHMNRHNDVKPFACTEPFCDKTFYSPLYRKVHIRNIHPTDTSHKCDLCEKAYISAAKLKTHRSTHFPSTIPCTICGKLLHNQKFVYRHQQSHKERLFRCEDCGKAFKNPYTLQVHKRIHTNEKPFICSKCGETFAYNCLLKAHEQRKHTD